MIEPNKLNEALLNAKQGDVRAFVELYAYTIDSQYPFVFGLCRKDSYLCQEVLMEGYYLAFTNLDRVDSGKDFVPWLNEILFKIGFARTTQNNVPYTYIEETLPTKIQRQQDYRERVIAKRNISDHIIVLAYYCGLTVRQVANTLNLSKNEVITLYKQGKERYNGVLKINEENKAIMQDMQDYQMNNKDRHLLLHWIFATCKFEMPTGARPIKKPVEEPVQPVQPTAPKVAPSKPSQPAVEEPTSKKKQKKVKNKKENDDEKDTPQDKILKWTVRGLFILLIGLFLIEPHTTITADDTNPEQIKYDVYVKSLLPVANIEAKQYNVPLEVVPVERNHYKIEPKKNGMIKVTVKLINTRKRTEIVNVTNGDSKPPVLLHQFTKDGKTTLFLQDKQSGINFDSIEGKLEDGTVIKPTIIDEDKCAVEFPFKDQALEVTIEDLAGNRLRLLLKPKP